MHTNFDSVNSGLCDLFLDKIATFFVVCFSIAYLADFVKSLVNFFTYSIVNILCSLLE